MIFRKKTLNLRQRLISLEKPILMGILNLTPDSFYDGGNFQHSSQAVHHCAKMLAEGATIVDVGGMSSRPGAAIVDADEECRRVLGTVEAILRAQPEALLSIDTIHAQTAREAVALGVAMVNDISAGSFDKNLLPVVAKFGVPYVLTHAQGLPEFMQNEPKYENIAEEVLAFFIKKIAALHSLGIFDIVIDPGFGFGKNQAHNYQLFKHLSAIKHVIQEPLLVGVSRKSMIYKALDTTPELALNGSTVLHTLAVLGGADILRVHDVRAAKEVLQLVELAN